jgi:hypothetical protein
VVGDAAEGGGAPGEALGLAPHRHDQLLQADAVHALSQVRVPALKSGVWFNNWFNNSTGSLLVQSTQYVSDSHMCMFALNGIRLG